MVHLWDLPLGTMPSEQSPYPDPAQYTTMGDSYGYGRPQESYPGFDMSNSVYRPYDSPGLWAGDDSDIQPLASSNLSTASAGSAPSSVVGSPRPPPGHLAPAEWAGAQSQALSPGIVGNEGYYPGGTDYSGAYPAIEDFQNHFEMTQPKPFVGELPQNPRTRFSPVSTAVRLPSLLANESEASPLSLSSPTMSAASSRRSSHFFTSPTTSTSSFSSPTQPAWSSPTCGVDALSPVSRARPTVSPFFVQSSGHFVPPLGSSYPSTLHPELQPIRMQYESQYPPPPTTPALTNSPQLRNGSASPYPNSNFAHFSNSPGPYSTPMDQRRPSVFSPSYGEQPFSDGENREKHYCNDCGKTFKDLKAHQLTHQNERPEKCPIQTCDYHTKGFARKYDKNRHTLTHYKGTMVCGFCPGSGSAAEKSFNRADVFKRHLTAVHGVEQSAPNSRKKTTPGGGAGKKLMGYAPDATGKCSTCTQTFSNAQDFYEHLDDCVLRIVQQEDPAEAVNARRLAEVENDREVHATLEKNQLPTQTQMTAVDEDDSDDFEDAEAEDDPADEDFKGVKTSPRRKGNPPNGVQKSRGMTHSRGGMPTGTKSRGRKRAQNYPASWGFDKGQMNYKKRVLTVFDGERRLNKDDMMLDVHQEVRIPFGTEGEYVTDLDVQSLKRAEGFHSATEAERGLWISDDPTEEQRKQMAAAMLQ